MGTLIDELPKEKNYFLIKNTGNIVGWFESIKAAKNYAKKEEIIEYKILKIILEVTAKGPFDEEL